MEINGLSYNEAKQLLDPGKIICMENNSVELFPVKYKVFYWEDMYVSEEETLGGIYYVGVHPKKLSTFFDVVDKKYTILDKEANDEILSNRIRNVGRISPRI